MIKIITIVVEIAITLFVIIPITIQSYKETKEIIKNLKNEEVRE